jgi:hypothetical protein
MPQLQITWRFWEVLGSSTQWNVSFVREVHDWEVDVFASFFQVLHSVKVSRDCADRLWWVSSKKGLFKVKSFRSLACSDSSGFPWKSVWQTQVPSKATFFVCSEALGKILTVDNLRKRHVIIVDRCCLCKRDGESVGHLLLHCDVAYALWTNIFNRFGIS